MDGFLVLSRLPCESILIGDDIEVVVTEVRGKRVRIGVRAPRELSVDRKEVREAKAADAAVAPKSR